MVSHRIANPSNRNVVWVRLPVAPPNMLFIDIERINYMNRTERQAHGFTFEDYVINKYSIQKSSNYTAKWDGMLNGFPVSIKCEKYKSDIELADFTRNANNTDDFYLIVGFWDGVKTNIVEEHILFIKGQEWHELFPSHFIEDFKTMLNSVTNNYSDDAKWKNLVTEQRKRWKKETNNLIRPRFKRDHKTQKRVQCAINYKDFHSYFIPKYEVLDVGRN